MGAAVFDIDSAKQGEQFLRLLFDDIEGKASIALWTLQDKRTHFYKNTPKQASINRFAGKDLYFALGFQPLEQRTNRAKANAVVGIPGLWADIDYLSDGVAHKKGNIPTSQKEAMKLIEAMPLTATFINCSGHGLHAYWLFKEPWFFSSPKEWKDAESITKRWEELLRIEAARHGWTVDSVYDLARILRVPGTMNMKNKDNPCKCEVLVYNPNARIEVDSVRAVLPALNALTPDTKSATTEKTEKQVKAEARHKNFILRSDAEPPAEKLTILQENDPEFAQMWAQKKAPQSDKSPSGWDMMLTHKLCAARWTDQEIVDTLLFFRRVKLQADMKLHRVDYFANTILKARTLFQRQGAADQLGEIQEERQAAGRELNDETRAEILAGLRDVLRIQDIVRIDKYLEDPPIYFIVTERGSTLIGTVDKIVSQTQFRYILAATFGVSIQHFKSQQWNNIVQSVLDICIDVPVSMESSEEGTLLAYLHDYLAGFGNRIGRDKDAAYRMRMPFQMGDRICIFATKFTKWLKGEHGVGMSLQKVGRLLLRIEAESTSLNFWPQGGKRTSNTVWVLPYAPFRDYLNDIEEK